MTQWLKADGDGRKPKDASAGVGWQCDAYSCLALVKGKLVSFIAKPDAIRDDCERAAILIAPMDIRQPCPAPKIVLDRGAALVARAPAPRDDCAGAGGGEGRRRKTGRGHARVGAAEGAYG